MLKIGEKLKYIRESLEITQKEVASKTGINSKTLSGYENNVSYPDLDTFRMLLLFYGVSADEILELPSAKFTGFNNIPSPPSEYSSDDKNFLELYRMIPRDLQIELMGEIKGIIRKTKHEQAASKDGNPGGPKRAI